MTRQTQALLSDPHPNTHIVYPYADAERMIEAVASTFAAHAKSKNAFSPPRHRDTGKSILCFLRVSVPLW